MPITFLSTPSARRATVDRFRFSCCHVISIHALREEGDPVQFCRRWLRRISIHALREEGDAESGFKTKGEKISIHALREEGDADLPVALKAN